MECRWPLSRLRSRSIPWSPGATEQFPGVRCRRRSPMPIVTLFPHGCAGPSGCSASCSRVCLGCSGHQLCGLNWSGALSFATRASRLSLSLAIADITLPMAMKPLQDCLLYTFLDLAYLRERDPKTLVQQLCDGGSDLIQLRAKGRAPEEIRRLAETI